MITNELNIGLIEAAKEKMPTGTNLANTLMDILYIGKEAIYRRLRGEVPFTLAEAAVISRKMGISLDKMIGVSFSNNAVFDLNVVHHTNTFETYHDILTKYVDAFDNIREDPTTEMATSSNILPQALYLKHDVLSKFRLFKWMYQNENIKCKHFDELEIPHKIYNIQKDFVNMTQQMKTTDYIWDNTVFEHVVRDIQFFSEIHLVSEEDKELIKDDLLLLTDELEELAGKGKYETGNDARIYISNIKFDATYSYVATSNSHISMIRIYSINAITTQDDGMFRSLKEWVQSLKKFSTQISESGEMQRIRFFNEQREIINTL